MKHKMIPDFHLFEGEGGGATAGAATASQSASEQDVTQIQYGRSTGEGQTNSQVGSDNGNGNEAVDLNAEWESLTGKGGKFHELLGQRVSSAIQERFRNQTDLQGQVDQLSEGLSPLFRNYGLEAGDFEGLTEAINNDDAFFQAGAERAGLTVDQYKENLKLQADSERLHKIEESYREEQRRQELFGQWEQDAAALQEAFPAFDLGREIETNEQFAQLLNNGVDVRTAFFAAHFDDLSQGMSAYAHRTATQQVVNNIQQRASRPMEGALGHAPAIQRKSDPSTLSGEDLDEINRRVANGETIIF